MGDFNAKLGKENTQRHVSSKHALHDVTSGNGVMCTEFAVRNSLVIKSTFFPHKRTHLGTCRMPDSDVLNIDHVPVAALHSSSVTDLEAAEDQIVPHNTI
jgi:hypothetical protein